MIGLVEASIGEGTPITLSLVLTVLAAGAGVLAWVSAWLKEYVRKDVYQEQMRRIDEKLTRIERAVEGDDANDR